LPFLSIRLLTAWLHNESIVHTAIDDLESFFWVLSWALIHILKKYGSQDPGILDVESALSSKDIRTNLTKQYFVELFWPDVAFGSLVRDWLGILKLARREVEQLRLDFSRTVGSPARDIACRRLELLCIKAYEQVLKSGFKHREEISRYSQWEDVIQAMPSSRRWYGSTFT
jgi:hypothetical protein